MDKEAYKYYVKTDCWAVRREAYLKNHDRCEGCGLVARLQVHHLTYENFGHEPDADLLAVCVGCHRAFHGLANATPKTWIEQRIQHLPDEVKRDRALKMLASA